MPDWGDAIRQQGDAVRAAALLKHATDDVKNRWSARSWSDVGTAALYTTRAITVFFAKEGVKFAFGYATGGLSSKITDWAGDYVPDLGEGLLSSAVDHVKDLIWDKVKEQKLRGMSLEDMEEFGGKLEPALDTALEADAKQKGATILDLDDPEKAFKAYVNNVAELALHAAIFKKYIQKARSSGFTYCDEVFYLGVELSQLIALKAQINTVGPKLAAYMQYVNTEVSAVDLQGWQRELEAAAEAVVKSTTISHKNHSNPNLVSAVSSCSKQHCYGQGQGSGWVGWAKKKAGLAP